MENFQSILRYTANSIERNNIIIWKIDSQERFDELFIFLFDSDVKLAIRAADAIEKVSLTSIDYFKRHRESILKLLDTADNNQIKWNLALIVSRLPLRKKELGKVWDKLTNWATDRSQSKVVRVNSVHGLFNLLSQCPELSVDFHLTVSQIETENLPSLKARLRLLNLASR
ncbi:MAG TPA: hypothetical protein VF676_03155 [Flavobacterium sp.]